MQPTTADNANLVETQERVREPSQGKEQLTELVALAPAELIYVGGGTSPIERF
jgi:hypothetical protein